MVIFGTPTKRQVSKRQVSKRPVSKRLKRFVGLPYIYYFCFFGVFAYESIRAHFPVFSGIAL
jgi:hypothetical protein